MQSICAFFLFVSWSWYKPWIFLNLDLFHAVMHYYTELGTEEGFGLQNHAYMTMRVGRGKGQKQMIKGREGRREDIQSLSFGAFGLVAGFCIPINFCSVLSFVFLFFFFFGWFLIFVIGIYPYILVVKYLAPIMHNFMDFHLSQVLPE